MAQDLTRAGVTIPSLPQRLVDLAMAVGTVQHKGQPVRYNLPEGWQISPLERTEAISLLSTLTSLLDPASPFERCPADQARVALITKLLRGLGGAADMSEIAADSKIAMYSDAIEDLPVWAIDKAIKRWARGECPRQIEPEPRYSFPPAPGVLRKMALLETEQPNLHKTLLTRLLAALPLERAMDPTPIPATPSVPALRRM